MAKQQSRQKTHEVIYLSSAGKLQWCSEQARQWLAFYFNEPKSRRNLPALIDQWIQLSRQAAKTQRKAITAPFHFSLNRKQLTVRFEEDDPLNPLLFLSEKELPDEQPGEPGREDKLQRLTRREREVLRWIGDGKTNAEIAIILRLSARTVDKHAQNIFRKLGVKSRMAALLQAMQKV